MFLYNFYSTGTLQDPERKLKAYAQQKFCISVIATVMILGPTTDGAISIY